jgi:hypothetical protein
MDDSLSSVFIDVGCMQIFYFYVSYNFLREIHKLIPEYNTSNHYIKPNVDSFTWGDGVWTTCMPDLKCCKYLLLSIGLVKTIAFYLWINNLYLLNIRLDNYYMMVDVLLLIFVISMMMMDLLDIVYLFSSRHIVLYLTCYERHWAWMMLSLKMKPHIDIWKSCYWWSRPNHSLS